MTSRRERGMDIRAGSVDGDEAFFRLHVRLTALEEELVQDPVVASEEAVPVESDSIHAWRAL